MLSPLVVLMLLLLVVVVVVVVVPTLWMVGLPTPARVPVLFTGDRAANNTPRDSVRITRASAAFATSPLVLTPPPFFVRLATVRFLAPPLPLVVSQVVSRLLSLPFTRPNDA